jgi:hypothetical protein
MTTEAPFMDSTGAPSWQPDPKVRALDVWHREWVEHLNRVRRLQYLIEGLEENLSHLRGELAKAEAAAKEHALSERPTL